MISGCPLACVRKTLKHIKAEMTHFVLTDMDLKKEKTSINDKIVNVIAD